MNWLGRLTFAKALAVAIVWPLMLLAFAVALVVVRASQAADGTAFMITVTGGPFLTIIVVGPSVLIVSLWAIARRRWSGTS